MKLVAMGEAFDGGDLLSGVHDGQGELPTTIGRTFAIGIALKVEFVIRHVTLQLKFADCPSDGRHGFGGTQIASKRV